MGQLHAQEGRPAHAVPAPDDDVIGVAQRLDNGRLAPPLLRPIDLLDKGPLLKGSKRLSMQVAGLLLGQRQSVSCWLVMLPCVQDVTMAQLGPPSCVLPRHERKQSASQREIVPLAGGLCTG